MPLIDDLSQETPDEELDRRKMLGLIGSGALAVAMGGTAITGIQYLSPNVLFEADTRYKVGPPDSIAVGNVLVLTRQKVLVVRTGDGFFALSATCTHLGCMTRYEPGEKRIFCPCHGSRFALDGTVTGGPAPRPLPRLRISLEGGQLVVDSKETVPPDFLLEV